MVLFAKPNPQEKGSPSVIKLTGQCWDACVLLGCMTQAMHVLWRCAVVEGPGGPGAPGRYTCLVKVVFRVIDVPDTPDDITTNWHRVQ